MVDNFFILDGNPTEIDESEFLKLTKQPGTISNKLYRPDQLAGLTTPRYIIKECHFLNFSLSKTVVKNIEFTDCTFTKCLFIATVFENCRFTNCAFVESNMYRSEFINVYIDPKSFEKCLDKTKHQNIGVGLYQELLNNSRKQSQPDHTIEALFEFRRWMRYQHQHEISQLKKCQEKFLPTISVFINWLAEISFGFGLRLKNYFSTIAVVVLFFAAINYTLAPWMGLQFNNVQPPLYPSSVSFIDAVYFTIVTLTTIGYGDITPTGECGRMIIASEGAMGFVLFATLASMIYKKIMP